MYYIQHCEYIKMRSYWPRHYITLTECLISVSSYQHCWDTSPCPGKSAPGSHVAPQQHLRPPPSPAPPGQRNGGDAGPAARGRGRARMRSGPPSSAAGEVRVRTLRRLRGSRPQHFQAATLMSSSALRLPCPAMGASRVSRKQIRRQRGARCHRMSRWPTADWQRSLQKTRGGQGEERNGLYLLREK